MNNEQRRCNECGLQVEAAAGSCQECGGDDLVWVSGSALDDLCARYRHVHAPRILFYEEPMVRCVFCGGRIEAAKALHSRYDGQAVCWPCKQAEEATA